MGGGHGYDPIFGFVTTSCYEVFVEVMRKTMWSKKDMKGYGQCLYQNTFVLCSISV